MTTETPDATLAAHVRAAAAGDRAAARAVIEAIQDGVYELALRMLGHPADAEDAAQEVLVIVLTHLGSFRGESAFKTWVWRIAANHIVRVRRGRREVVTFELLEERLRTGLRRGEESTDPPDPETDALAGELRLRCTQAMLLSLDRDLRIAYVLGDVLDLPGGSSASSRARSCSANRCFPSRRSRWGASSRARSGASSGRRRRTSSISTRSSTRTG